MTSVKNLVRQIPSLRRTYRKLFPVHVEQPDWSGIIGPEGLPEPGPTAPRVLLAPMVGGPGITTLDSVLAAALRLRGAHVDVLLCDEALPACQNSLLSRLPNTTEFLRYGPQADLCAACFQAGDAMLRSLGVRVLHLSDFLTRGDYERAVETARDLPLSEIPDYKPNGVAIGEHAQAGAIRFFAREALQREPEGEAVLRRYLQAALLTQWSLERLLERLPYQCASFHHGIYVPQGIIGEIARRHRVRVVNWMIAYRKSSFIFSHGDTYHRTLMDEPVSSWEGMYWTPDIEEELLTYLRSRWSGAEDWIHFNRAPQEDREAIAQELSIDFSKPCIGLLTNVTWDAQLHYPQNAFPSMLHWIHETIEYFSSRPDLQLLIRIHPAEVTGQIPSREPVMEELLSRWGTLPPNVFVVPPESSLSTYTLMLQCDSVLIYGTKTGVELTSFGVPVIVAGEAWIRNKGITTDVHSAADYREVLDNLPLGRRLDNATVERARKYAYHFFFRRMIPLQSVTPADGAGWAPYRLGISSLQDLLPGRDPGLDIICDGILNGTPFIYPAEERPSHPRVPTAVTG